MWEPGDLGRGADAISTLGFPFPASLLDRACAPL